MPPRKASTRKGTSDDKKPTISTKKTNKNNNDEIDHDNDDSDEHDIDSDNDDQENDNVNLLSNVNNDMGEEKSSKKNSKSELKKESKKNAPKNNKIENNNNNIDDGDNDDDEEDDIETQIERYQNVIIKSFTSMVEDESTIPSQLRRMGRVYFNSSEETEQSVSIQFLESVFRLSAQLFLLDQKTDAFQIYSRLLPRVWKTICADMFMHCKLVEGWSEDKFKERIIFLQENATSAIFRFLCRELTVGPKGTKILAMQLLHQFVHDLDTDFELSDRDGLIITTALMPQLLSKQYDIKKLALNICPPFLFSTSMFDTIRFLAVSDPHDDIRRYALWLLYRPAFTQQYRSQHQMQGLDALIFIARMQDESPLVRSTLLQLFEEKELRITPIATHSLKKNKMNSNDENNGDSVNLVEETDIKSVNNQNVYKTYGQLFTCNYSTSRNSSSKLSYRQKLWVIKQALCDPDERIVWQMMNIITKLFCCENFNLIDFVYFLSTGQSLPPHIFDTKSITPEQLQSIKTLKDTLLLTDDAVYQHNNQNNNKIWTSSISQLTTSLNRSNDATTSSNGTNSGNNYINPQIFTLEKNSNLAGSRHNNATSSSDPLYLFMSSSNGLGSVLNSTIYQDLCVVLSYIVCAYTWRHTIDLGDSVEYALYKRRRVAPSFGTMKAIENNNQGANWAQNNAVSLANDGDDDEDDILLDALMNKNVNSVISGQNNAQDDGKNTKKVTKKKGAKNDPDNNNDNENDAKGTNTDVPKAVSTVTPSTKSTASDSSTIGTYNASLDLNLIKLNTRQVVLEMPNFTKMLNQTTFHLQYTLYGSQLAEYSNAMEEYNNIMMLKEQGNEEAMGIDVSKPEEPLEPIYENLYENDIFDPNTPILTSGLCLLWYLLLSSLSGQSNNTYIDVLQGYQKKYQQQELMKEKIKFEKNAKNAKNFKTENPENSSLDTSHHKPQRYHSLPIIDFNQVKASQPRLSCPGYSSPQNAIMLSNTRYLQDIQPQIGTTLSLLPLLDQFSQPSLTLHILLLSYHIDVQQTSYNDLALFYQQYEGFISSPEFKNSLLALVFLFLRTAQPIIMVRYYQQTDHIHSERYQYLLQYQQQQYQHVLQYKNDENLHNLQNLQKNDEKNYQNINSVDDIDTSHINFDTIEGFELPEQPRSYVGIITELLTSFMDTILAADFTPRQSQYQLTNHFTKNINVPIPVTNTKDSNQHYGNNENNGLGSQGDYNGQNNEQNNSNGDIFAQFDEPENDLYTPHSLRQKYRTQMLLLQSYYNELRHSDNKTDSIKDELKLKRIKRAAVVKKEYNKYRNYYYLYVGHMEFLLKRLLIMVFDLFMNCPVISQPNIPSNDDNDTTDDYTDRLTTYFSINICCTEDVIQYVLNTVIYPLLGWKKYSLNQEVETIDENGNPCVEIIEKQMWFELDFYTVDVNYLLISILTQSALLSTNNVHITIVLQFLLMFTSVATSNDHGVTVTGDTNDNLFNFKSYNTSLCQTINYSPTLNNIIDILNGKGFYIQRSNVFNQNDENDHLIKKSTNTHVPSKENILITSATNAFLDITRQNGFSHMFLHPILQLQSIKGISDILTTFINLVPITSHQHSYDLLGSQHENEYQPREILMTIHSNDAVPSDLMASRLKQQQQEFIGIPVEIIFQCHQTLLGYAQSYIDTNNDLSGNYSSLIQRYPMLEIENTIGNIYASITKFHYRHERHQELGKQIISGKGSNIHGDGKNDEKRSSKGGNYNDILDDDIDNDVSSDDAVDDYSEYEFDEELQRLIRENDQDMDSKGKFGKLGTKMNKNDKNKDYNKKSTSDIRSAYLSTQSALFYKMSGLMNNILRLVRYTNEVNLGELNHDEIIEKMKNEEKNHQNLSNLNSNSKKNIYSVPTTNAIFTGDIACISDLSYDHINSLQYAPSSTFDFETIDGLILPLQGLKATYTDHETTTRISQIFSNFHEEQLSVETNQSSLMVNDGVGTKRNSSSVQGNHIISENVLNLFLHEDIFLLFKSIQPSQLDSNDHNKDKKSRTGDVVQDRAIKRATPYELIPYSMLDNPYLLLRGVEDYLVERSFFHSLSSTSQLLSTHEFGHENNENNNFLFELFDENCQLRRQKHEKYINNTRWDRKQQYSSLYQVPMDTAHLDLYTNTYINIIYQGIQNTAIFSLCKLLFFNRVPYVLTQQYLSLLTIATVVSHAKKYGTKGMALQGQSNSLGGAVGSNFKNFTSANILTSSVQQQDLYEILQLFFHCYIKLNFNTMNLITPHNQHYVYTLHLYQNIAKQIAFKKKVRDDGNDDRISIDTIVYGFAPYDFTLVKNKKKNSKIDEKMENRTTEEKNYEFNFFDPENISVENLPTLHHIKDNLLLRKYLWNSLSAKQQSKYKQLYHSSHFASDWGISNGVSVCDHLSLLSTTAPTVIFDILNQFSKPQALILIPLFIDFIVFQLSPATLSHSTSPMNPLVSTNSNLPVNFANMKPHHIENINSNVQHGIYTSLSTSISPLVKFGIDLLSIISNTDIFKNNFISTMGLIKVILASVAEWQILPRDFYPLFHQYNLNNQFPDDLVSKDLYPDNQIVDNTSGDGDGDNEEAKNQQKKPISTILNNKPLLEHTISSPSRRAVIGFYLFLEQVIAVYGLIKNHEMMLPEEKMQKNNKGTKNEKENIASQKKLVLFYNSLVDNVKDLVSKLVYFLSFTRATSHNAPANAKKLTKNAKKMPAKKVLVKKNTKAPAKKAPVRSTRTTRRGKADGSDNDDDVDEREEKSDGGEEDEKSQGDDNNSDDDNQDEDDNTEIVQSQLINYQDPLIHFLNKKVITATTTTSLSTISKESFTTPYLYDVFFLHQLVQNHQDDHSYTVDSLVRNGLTLESLTTIEIQNSNNNNNNHGLAGGRTTLIVDNDIEDFITTIVDQRRVLIKNKSENVPQTVWKRHFIKFNYLNDLIMTNNVQTKKKKQSIVDDSDNHDGVDSDDNEDNGRYVKRTGKTPKKSSKTPRKKLNAAVDDDDDNNNSDSDDEKINSKTRSNSKVNSFSLDDDDDEDENNKKVIKSFHDRSSLVNKKTTKKTTASVTVKGSNTSKASSVPTRRSSRRSAMSSDDEPVILDSDNDDEPVILDSDNDDEPVILDSDNDDDAFDTASEGDVDDEEVLSTQTAKNNSTTSASTKAPPKRATRSSSRR